MIIFIATGGTEATFASKSNKMKVATDGATKHSTALRRIATGDHAVNVLYDGFSRTKEIKDMLIIISKNGLQNVHTFILQKMQKKKTPIPLMSEGLGELRVSETLFYLDMDDSVVSFGV